MSRYTKAAPVLAAPLAARLLMHPSNCEETTGEKKADINRKHMVALYLTEESQKSMKKHLSNFGEKGEYDLSKVVIRRNCTSKDSYPYEPLFGERAAFRMKSIIKTDDGLGAVSKLFLSLTPQLKGTISYDRLR